MISRYVFYTDYFLLACQFIAIITIISYLKKQRLAIQFLIYCLSSLILIVSDYLLFFYYYDNQRDKLIECDNILFTLIEYLVFFNFFRSALISRTVISCMHFFLYVLVIACVFFFYSTYFTDIPLPKLRRISDLIISTELFLLASCCIVYYYELFIKEPLYNLSESPAFWIVTGLFCYSILIIPFFLISEFISTQKKIYYVLFGVHYISFGFLFLTISKAFSCKKSITS